MDRTIVRSRSSRFFSRLQATDGLSTVEYIIILTLIAIVGIAAWQKFGSTVKAKINGSTGTVNSELPTTSSP